MHWQTSRYTIDLNRPKIMGIVNVTPDSFSDGGAYINAQTAQAHCEKLLKDGADILDIGAESTRPGADVVPVEEELARILPVLRYALTLGVPISVDTYKPQVMQAALDLGADIINDVYALRWQSPTSATSATSEKSALMTSAEIVRQHPNCGVCLMHMHRDPSSMHLARMEGDAVPQVLYFLEHATQSLCALGVDSARICIDPGIGFGKTVEQNFALLARQNELTALGFGLVAGWSRKSSLVAVCQTGLADAASLAVRDRVVPSVTAAVLAVQNGAHVLRVHDVKETAQALKVLAAMQRQVI